MGKLLLAILLIYLLGIGATEASEADQTIQIIVFIIFAILFLLYCIAKIAEYFEEKRYREQFEIQEFNKKLAARERSIELKKRYRLDLEKQKEINRAIEAGIYDEKNGCYYPYNSYIDGYLTPNGIVRSLDSLVHKPKEE